MASALNEEERAAVIRIGEASGQGWLGKIDLVDTGLGKERKKKKNLQERKTAKMKIK